MEAVHRILTGQTERPWQLKVAGAVVLIWFAMDLHQYISWLFETGCK